NGLAVFAAEATVRLTSLSSFSVLMNSSGKRDSVDGQRTAFRLGVYSNGQLEGKLNVAGTTVTLTSAAGAIVTGTTYHVALTYDGATLRLFLNGTQQASAVSRRRRRARHGDRKSTRVNSSHQIISYAVFCLKNK